MWQCFTIKILFTINSLKKKEKKKNYSFKTLFTIPVDLKSTHLSLERANLLRKNLFELKTFPKIMNTDVDQLHREWSPLIPHVIWMDI